MSQHQPVFTVEKAFPRAEAAPGHRRCRPAGPRLRAAVATAPLGSTGGRRRASAGCAAAPVRRRRHVAVLAGAADLRLAVLDGRPLRGLDRRRLCQGRQHDDRAEDLRLYRRRARWTTTSRSRRGQVLARIDDRDFKVALEQAKADVAAAEAGIANKQAALAAQQSVIDAAQATVAARPGQRRPSPSRTTSATPTLAAKGFGSVQNAQQAAARIAAARAAVTRDTAALATAIKQVDVLKAELAQAQAALARAKARPGPGRAEPLLRHDRRARRRRGRQPHAARRPVRPGRHAADGRRADRGRLHRRQLQGDAAHRCACRASR